MGKLEAVYKPKTSMYAYFRLLCLSLALFAIIQWRFCHFLAKR